MVPHHLWFQAKLKDIDLIILEFAINIFALVCAYLTHVFMIEINQGKWSIWKPGAFQQLSLLFVFTGISFGLPLIRTCEISPSFRDHHKYFTFSLYHLKSSLELKLIDSQMITSNN